MARIRSIKPEFWTDEKIVELDFVERLLFIGLWNFADDQGYLDYSPKRIKMQIFPGDNVDVVEGLKKLHEVSLIEAFDGPRGVVLWITHWMKHQRVSNPAKPRFQGVDLRKRTSIDGSSVALATSLESSRVIGKGKEGNGGEGNSSSEIADALTDTDRPDVDRLCTHLADRIVANGSPEPSITKRWRDAARLMLDKEGRTEEQIHSAIDWCQNDGFWKANILSMPKLREKYDQLRLAAQRNTFPGQRSGGPDWEAAMQRAQVREAQMRLEIVQ
jgi:hypothetical protein